MKAVKALKGEAPKGEAQKVQPPPPQSPPPPPPAPPRPSVPAASDGLPDVDLSPAPVVPEGREEMLKDPILNSLIGPGGSIKDIRG